MKSDSDRTRNEPLQRRQPPRRPQRGSRAASQREGRGKLLGPRQDQDEGGGERRDLSNEGIPSEVTYDRHAAYGGLDGRRHRRRHRRRRERHEERQRVEEPVQAWLRSQEVQRREPE